MKVLIVSDAWHPQINGVVRTYEATVAELTRMGHEVRVIGPDLARKTTIPLPVYPEIGLEFFAHRRIRAALKEFKPDVVHIATEGPLGWAARRECLRSARAFTTAYHTHYAAYIAARVPRGLKRCLSFLAYTVLRRFHAPAGAVMVATASLEAELRARGFQRLALWLRGIDTHLFHPGDKNLATYKDLPRPILLYVGRVAVEKNLPAFLAADLPGTKIVIGRGPDLAALTRAYPKTRFLGAITDENLAKHYAAADLFVFPSMTDTFGLVLLEACASGLRVAAYPAPGPRDIFADKQKTGAFAVLDPDLGKAILRALALPNDPAPPRAFAEALSWHNCTEAFFDHLQAVAPATSKWWGMRRNRAVALAGE
jgi:glycosyltransferase involved in cell wall biosynthesis